MFSTSLNNCVQTTRQSDSFVLHFWAENPSISVDSLSSVSMMQSFGNISDVRWYNYVTEQEIDRWI